MVVLIFLVEKYLDYTKIKVKHLDSDINNNHVKN